MEFFHQFVYRPRRLWIRRINFWIHLWIGIILSVYLIIIGTTGSILVFRDELETATGSKPWNSIHARPPFADIATVIDKIHTTYPKAQIVSVLTPTKTDHTFVALLQSSGRSRAEITIAAHPATGEVLGPVPREKSWISEILQLHETLLMGPEGRRVNGAAAALLLLLNLTGLVVWWPGLRSWTRALAVDFRRTWRRINFDFHRAAGFWTLAIVSFWAVSGIYFGWSRQVFLFINRFSPIITARPPVVTVRPPEDTVTPPGLDTMIAQAYSFDPGTTLKGIGFPTGRRSPLRVFMSRGNSIGWEYADTLYFSPYTGQHVATWRYGVNQSIGDWLVWLQIPLHFGTYWGLSFKLLWAALGLCIPLLTITGALMYWNRILKRKWKRLTAHSGEPPRASRWLATPFK